MSDESLLQAQYDKRVEELREKIWECDVLRKEVSELKIGLPALATENCELHAKTDTTRQALDAELELNEKLRGEVERLTNGWDECRSCWAKDRALLSKLRGYARHKTECWGQRLGAKKCICGLEKFLEEE